MTMREAPLFLQPYWMAVDAAFEAYEAGEKTDEELTAALEAVDDSLEGGELVYQRRLDDEERAIKALELLASNLAGRDVNLGGD